MAIMLASAIGISTLVLSSCSKPGNAAEGAAPKKKPPLVAVAPVEQGAIARRLQLPGTVRPDVVANVLSPAEGKITSLGVREGDYVAKNAVIGRISPSMREDILNAARLKKDEGEDLDFARKQYREIAVVAPISGVVAIRNSQPGDMVIQRQKLLEVQSMCATCLHVEVPVPEREMPFVKKGMPVEIRPDALAGETFSGKVTRVYPRLEEKTRTGTVEVSLPAGAGEKLKSGMFARVSFVLQKAEDALLVPAEAVVLTANGAPAVYTVKDGKATLHTVEIGLEADGKAQILGGITAGDLVITAGNENLKNGASVRLPGAGKKPSGERKQEDAN